MNRILRITRAISIAIVGSAVALGACRTGRDYPDPAAPRYRGTARADTTSRGDTLRVVSFNIEFSMQVPRAVRILLERDELRTADVVLLQEMDAPGAQMVADSLGMHYVYYPAIFNRLARKDFGNAVLSRWPIRDDAKLILPSRSRYAKTQRIATAATIRFRGRDVRVYSTHLGTPADLGHEGRVAQLHFIMADAARFDHAILGGDMNSTDLGDVAAASGYATPTENIPWSSASGRLDHIYMKGLRPIDAGTEDVPPAVSDHRPIWATAIPVP